MTERYKRAMEQVTLPAEADERILSVRTLCGIGRISI